MDSLASKEEIENKRRTWLDCIEKVNTDVTSQMRGALAEVADDTLYLVDGAVFAPVSQERSLDPLASITWEDVIEVLTLALHMRSNNWLPTPWVILAIIVLGFNESMLLLKNHLYLMALFIIFLLPKAGWTQLDIAGEFRLGATVAATAIPDGWMGLDDSIKTFSDALDTTETVIWNGPMGVFEFIKFAAGTMAISKKLVDLSGKGVTTIIGGGDSVAAVEQAGLGDKMSHISTGGGGVMLNVNTSPQAQFFAPDAACLPPVLNFARNS